MGCFKKCNPPKRMDSKNSRVYRPVVPGSSTLLRWWSDLDLVVEKVTFKEPDIGRWIYMDLTSPHIQTHLDIYNIYIYIQLCVYIYAPEVKTCEEATQTEASQTSYLALSTGWPSVLKCPSKKSPSWILVIGLKIGFITPGFVWLFDYFNRLKWDLMWFVWIEWIVNHIWLSIVIRMLVLSFSFEL